MWRHVGSLQVDVSEEGVTFILPEMEEKRSSETSIYNKLAWSHIPEDGNLHMQNLLKINFCIFL
jgi:hypothetical protein